MRPEALNPLFASASTLPGIGPKLELTLGRLLRGPDATGTSPGARVIDLLFHTPSGLIDRRHRPRISDLPEDGIDIAIRILNFGK